MKTRILAVTVFLAVLLVFLLLGVYTRVAFGIICGLICSFEITRAVKSKHPTVQPWVCYVFTVVSGLLVLFELYQWILYALFLLILISFSVSVISPKHHPSEVLMTLGMLFYPLSLILMMIYILTLPNPVWYTVIILGSGSAAFCDAFALFGGMAFGKHKLAPLISPNKTIEGSVSGSASTLLLGVLLYFLFNKLNIIEIALWKTILICFLNSIVGQFGDLIASAIKREFAIKDYSKLIPGHGGLMDRLDSHFFTIPLSYLLLTLLSVI